MTSFHIEWSLVDYNLISDKKNPKQTTEQKKDILFISLYNVTIC